MQHGKYLMESDEEALRLDLKTAGKTVEKQALWAGIEPGMRVADIGCGSGKTTFYLDRMVQPNGQVIGVDRSEERIVHARRHYSDTGIEFVCKDMYGPLDDLGGFDFVWVRFILEYHRLRSFEIVKNISGIVKPGGILCLIDLDYNCLSHFGLPRRLERTIRGIMNILEKNADFDPYAGRKLYSYIYDLGFEDIDVEMAPHHLIFGELKETDAFNWTKKVEVAARNSGYRFEEYGGGYEEFCEDFERSFADPRRFTYTPVILCRGRKPNL